MFASFHVLSLLLLLVGCTNGNGKEIVLGAGASLPARLYRNLAYAYQFAVPTTTVTYVSTGSGKGIRLIKGEEQLDGMEEIDFAGSDSVLQPSDYGEVPDLQMYPSTATAVVPIYRLNKSLSEVGPLIFSRETLALIFMGNITRWDDPRIVETNPNVHRFPSQDIRVVVRQGRSGTTEIFTKALASFSPAFRDSIGASNQPDWPSTFETAEGTDGVVGTVLTQDYTISFAVLSDARDRDVPYASMVNRAGETVQASTLSVQSAVSELSGLILDNPRHTADLQEGSSSTAWPISGLTYFVLRKDYVARTCATRVATLDFLEWYWTSPTSERVQEQLGFARLPESIREGMLERLLEDITCENGRPARADANRVERVEIPVPALAVPLFTTFSAAYAQVDSSVEIVPVSYCLSPAVSRSITQYPSDVSPSQLFVSPLLVAGVAVVYHLEGVDEQLLLPRETLAQMWRGEVFYWDDDAIQSANPGVRIPHTSIRIVSREDQSHATLVFTKVVGLEISMSLEVSDIVVGSDSQVEAVVFAENGAIGYVAADDSSVRSSVVRVADTYGKDGRTRVRLNTESLEACPSEGIVKRAQEGITTFDVDRVNNRMCWPFLLSFDITVDASDVESQCAGGASSSLEFVSWLFNPDTDIGEPLAALGAVAIPPSMRNRNFELIYDDCLRSVERTRLIKILSAAFSAVLLLTCSILACQYRRVAQQKQLIDDLKKQSFVMRSVVANWSPKDNAAISNKPVSWFWQEDVSRMDRHEVSRRKDPCWIKYDVTVSALLEAHHAKVKTNPRATKPKVEFSVGNDAAYIVDVKTMTQTNKRTNFERRVMRHEESTPNKSAHTVTPQTPVRDEAVDAEEGKRPAAPINLPSVAESDEPFLELRLGSIIQTMKTSPDQHWSYGTVIVEPENDVETSEPAPPTKVSLHNGRTAIVSKTTGWFSHDKTEEPDRKDLARLAEQVGGAGASLKEPPHWEPVKNALVAERFRLPNNSVEFQRVASTFRTTLDNHLSNTVIIQWIERIQNVAMYQSYSVKRQSLLHREVNSNHDAARYERQLFHGTNEDTIPKIIQQGFNRSFCGKNATVYGKGVYFAADATYSASNTYAVPNFYGEQFMFVVRVTVGEYCRGRQDALTPDIRDRKTHQLYDSTVDDVSRPRVFVTYHDAQAYPEYLICFKQGSSF